jgi:hypothetical protein
MQSPRETIDRLMRRQKAERVGVSDNPWGDTLRKWVGQGYPRNEKGNPVDPVEHFGFDIAGMAGFEWVARPGAKELLQETAEWKIERDGNGAAFGDVCLYETMLTDPDWVRDYCRVYTDLYKECCTALFGPEGGMPDAVWVYDDFGYKNTTFCRPSLYGELIFPYYRELVAFLHAMDLPVVLHTCGYTESIMDLVVEARFDYRDFVWAMEVYREHRMV